MHASECIHAAAMGFGWKHSLCRRRITFGYFTLFSAPSPPLSPLGRVASCKVYVWR